MQIEHKKIGGKGLFFIRGDKGTLAEMVYTMPSADKMIIEHTEVSEADAPAVTAGLTVTVLVACAEQPFDVPVTVYTVVVSGETLIEAEVDPPGFQL